jgi:hypothetical protein
MTSRVVISFILRKSKRMRIGWKKMFFRIVFAKSLKFGLIQLNICHTIGLGDSKNQSSTLYFTDHPAVEKVI